MLWQSEKLLIVSNYLLYNNDFNSHLQVVKGWLFPWDMWSLNPLQEITFKKHLMSNFSFLPQFI